MVCDAGIFNTASMALQSNPWDSNEYTGGLPLPEASREAIERWNPARSDLLKNWKTPMLVIHNEGNSLCPVSEGQAAYEHLQASSVPSSFLNFADEGHGITKEENLLEWYRHVFAWVDRFTGIAAEERRAVIDDGATT
jgi:dipeptidyl aminopeptidase/acylaminoacyl peptidase